MPPPPTRAAAATGFFATLPTAITERAEAMMPEEQERQQFRQWMDAAGRRQLQTVVMPNAAVRQGVPYANTDQEGFQAALTEAAGTQHGLQRGGRSGLM